jgi:hypothetical protein
MNPKHPITHAATALSLALAAAGAAQAAPPLKIDTVMTGLAAPRGMAFGGDGALYVTEAGSGGEQVGTTADYFGLSSALSKWSAGVQTRVMSGLPSLATAAGKDAAGLQDIAFDGSGQAYGVIGLGLTAKRALLGAAGADMGTLVKLNPGAGTRSVVADIAQHEIDHNPAGGTSDSNPYGLAMNAAGHFIVADAGANTFLQATAAGAVTTLGVLPARPNPLPFGPPLYQSVPTTAAIGADGKVYIGELTGFPFPPGAANVQRYDPATGATTVAHGGFSTIVDLEFDDRGNLYVLQYSTNLLQGQPGALFRIDKHGNRTEVATNGLLVQAGGLAIGPDDRTLYVSVGANDPLGGQVLRIAPVPEPASWALMLAGIAAVAVAARRRCAPRRATAAPAAAPPAPEGTPRR